MAKQTKEEKALEKLEKEQAKQAEKDEKERLVLAERAEKDEKERLELAEQQEKSGVVVPDATTSTVAEPDSIIPETVETAEPAITVNKVVGGTEDDLLNMATAGSSVTNIDKFNGHAGSDTISTADGNDLAAGDMVGDEWSFVGGKWVYDSDKIVSDGSADARAYDDVIRTGAGDDVVLGNGGNDQLYSGVGDDTVNAGTGDDIVFGGSGDDLLNLEDGNDVAQGGTGDDVINAGAGDDLVYGDDHGNLLATTQGTKPTSFDQFAETGNWTIVDENGQSSMSQSVNTAAGETYAISFELAANTASGQTSGSVEVLWNGEVVGTVETQSGVYETHSIDVLGGGDGELTFREIGPPASTGPEINNEGPISYYQKQVTIDGEEVTVAAFAPGQAKLYQVIDGQLKVFDTAENEYQDAGDPTGLGLNAIGFNQQDDMIYGLAKQAGEDALGNPVEVKDIIMLDAQGNAYRVGEAPMGDYVGDFDDAGNLWTFNGRLNNITKIDVDNLDPDGNLSTTHYEIPNSLFNGQVFDIAFNAAEQAFYAIDPPSANGEPGTIHRVDVSDIDNGGEPQITSLDISGTLVDGEMIAGMARGAYGAVFLDGDGNLYYGLNKGDHDLDGSTGASGGIYKVTADWDAGTAYSELKAEAETTGRNDGAVDPRSSDAFVEVDQEAPFLIRNPTVEATSGGNDDLRGAEGNDELYGGFGGDTLYGGEGDDSLSGDEGADKIYGGSGGDTMSGGAGDDKLTGGAGDDKMSGGDGKDYLNAGAGNDSIDGGSGDDKIVGGAGEDQIAGGAGNDNLWGGNWWKDGSSDTFVVSGGGGKDMIHDFEAGVDQIDLSAYGLEFADLSGLISDKGWATEIDLSGLDGGIEGDKLIIKSIDPDDLDESTFIL